MSRAGTVIATLVWTTITTPAFADPFCTKLDALMTAAADGAGFTLNDVAVDCTSSLGLGGTVALHCAWPYAYRAPQATADFEETLAHVGNCAEEIAAPASTVSHPDSYDLRQFSLNGGTVSVSLKDKGALEQTYVFLRVERPAP